MAGAVHIALENATGTPPEPDRLRHVLAYAKLNEGIFLLEKIRIGTEQIIGFF